jgi:flavin-dependent dehydrogenase
VTVSRVEPSESSVRVHAEDGRAFDGRAAIVATGAASGVLKRSGALSQQPRAMLAARVYFEDLQREVARTFQLRFDNVPLPGYGWVFPVGRNAANLGVGYLPRRYASRTATVHQAYERFVSGRALRPVLAGATQTGPLKGYPIRVDFLRAPTGFERTLLVGEAAGLVNPLTGEGIDYALESGAIAADFLADRFQSDTIDITALRDYDQLLRARFEKVFRFSELVRDWYCRPPLLNVLVPLANRYPELRQLLANTVLGEREPRGYGALTIMGRLMVYLVRTRGHSPAR